MNTGLRLIHSSRGTQFPRAFLATFQALIAPTFPGRKWTFGRPEKAVPVQRWPRRRHVAVGLLPWDVADELREHRVAGQRVGRPVVRP